MAAGRRVRDGPAASSGETGGGASDAFRLGFWTGLKESRAGSIYGAKSRTKVLLI